MDVLPTIKGLSEAEKALYQDAYEKALADTGDAEKSHLAAAGAVYKKRLLVHASKSIDGKGVIVAGWGMLFSDALDPDLTGEYFDQMTLTLNEYYAHAPLWVEHGASKAYGSTPVGKRISLKVYPRGIWVEHELDPEHPLYAQTVSDVQKGKYCYSSDSIKHHVAQGFDPRDGYLGVWPIAGWSLVEEPAEPALGPVVLKQLEAALKAREAQGAANRPQHNSQEGTIMDPQEILKALAAFLGTEPTAEAVGPELQDYIADMNESGVIDPDLSAALSMDDTAEQPLEPTVMAAKLLDLYNSATVPVATPEAAKRRNPAALKPAADAAAKAAPGVSGIPFVTPTGAKSTTYGSFNVNRGAEKPGLIDMFRFMKFPHMASAAKAQSYAIGPTGGYLLRHELSTEIIPPLRAAIPLFSMGVDFYDMSGVETLTIGKDKTEHSAYWVGEGTTIPASNETIGGITLYPRPLAARVIVPNKFLTNSTVNYEARVREKVAYQIRNAIMYAALFGTGGVTGSNTGAQPRGLANLSGVTSTPLATNGAKPKPTDMSNAIGRIEDQNIEANETWSWLMSPRTMRTFKQMTDTTGNPLYRDRWNDGGDVMIEGLKVYKSTIVPNDQTAGSNTASSSIFVGAWNEMALTMSDQFEFLIDPYSQSSTLNTVIIAYTYADLAIKHDEAFQILTGVTA